MLSADSAQMQFFLLSTLLFHFLVQFFSSPVFGAGLTECYTAGSCGL